MLGMRRDTGWDRCWIARFVGNKQCNNYSLNDSRQGGYDNGTCSGKLEIIGALGASEVSQISEIYLLVDLQVVMME